MDERLEKAIDFSNYVVTLNNQKRLLKEEYEENLLHYFDGGQFTITKELITFVGLLVNAKNTEDVVLTDDNNIPIKIEDLAKFYEDVMDCYFSASNSYHTKYNTLKKQRSVEALVGIDID
jgi:flagellar capping protein FliD|tara:strand:+ start:55 stop:414 length:360 start_codon:yes stop_codon:yes gene_type:complete